MVGVTERCRADIGRKQWWPIMAWPMPRALQDCLMSIAPVMSGLGTLKFEPIYAIAHRVITHLT